MTVRWLVRGAVQGVGFRYFVVRRAQLLSLTGWTRNLPDGRVEVVARGGAEELTVLESALGEGPPRARVAGLEREQISDELSFPKSFEVR